MNISPLIKSVGKALSKVPWEKVAKVSKELAGAAAVLVGIYRSRDKASVSQPTAQPPKSKQKDDPLIKTVAELKSRLATLEADCERIRSSGEEQARVATDIAEHLTTLFGVLEILSFRLNVFIVVSVASFLVCIWLLVRGLVV